MQLTALPRAMVKSGLIQTEDIKPKKKRKGKEFKCHKCNTVMTKVDDSNIMYCPNCGQYFLFDKIY